MMSMNCLEKVVLLHIENKYAAIPIAYAINMPENYENMKYIFCVFGNVTSNSIHAKTFG